MIKLYLYYKIFITKKQLSRTNKLIHYRDLIKEIKRDNFYISTKVDFKKISKKEWDNVFSQYTENHNKSKSGSEYVIVDNEIYRKSNHWGAVSSCEWTLENKGNLISSMFITGNVEYGKANIKDFKLFLRKNLLKRDYIVDPEWKEKFKNLKVLVDILYKIKNKKNFRKYPTFYKKFIGQNSGYFHSQLKDIK